MMVHQGAQKLQKRGTDSKIPRFFVFLLIGSCVCVFSGCSKKQSQVPMAHRLAAGPSVEHCSVDHRSVDHRSMVNRTTTDHVLSVRQREASMADIPLPVGGVLVPTVTSQQNSSSRSSILTYCVTTKHESLVRFYEQEMMRLGWNKRAQSSGEEELLVFESPLKMAIIQMRPEKPHKGWKLNKKIILTLHETSKEN